MQGQSATAWTDRWLAELAESQHGVVARAQLLAAGMTKSDIDSRLALGRLYIVQRAVYAVGRPTVPAKGMWLASVLSLGDRAVLSHASAAALWGLRPPSAGPVHVTVDGIGGRKRREGVVLHRSREVEHGVCEGIPVTTVARTLLDLAASASPRVLERAVERAEALRLFDLRAVERVGRPGRAGTKALRAAISRWDGAPTRSELERRFLDLCRDRGLPRPLVNSQVAGFEVDFAWPEQRVVVETDGLEHHGTRQAVARDRTRDARLALEGWRTHRFTWTQVVDEPHTVAAVLDELLQSARLSSAA